MHTKSIHVNTVLLFHSELIAEGVFFYLIQHPLNKHIHMNCTKIKVQN